jgi:hypothetical protein
VSGKQLDQLVSIETRNQVNEAPERSKLSPFIGRGLAASGDCERVLGEAAGSSSGESQEIIRPLVLRPAADPQEAQSMHRSMLTVLSNRVKLRALL